ncbi:glycosyl hydrolase 115 family protein [Lysobacter changpingensis]|uniref:glycosyl hydrolase 115 family protein n=1 Tax=Lysobacter changpingensis TaxID=2792784 RepID=UPI001A8C0F2F|nr:glycosyl hydrolase 115 family protein [Lysobacter changpingensis]
MRVPARKARRDRARLVRGCAAVVLLLGIASPAIASEDCAQPAAICDNAVTGALALVDHGRVARVIVDEADFAGVLRAARDLEGDLAKIAGTRGDAKPAKTAIIAGTLGRSPRIDRIVAARKLDTTGVAGTWEGYLLQVVERPEPGIDRALVVAGADKRGTIFGLYELSRRLGVSPWNWWADVPVQPRETRYIAPGRFVDAPQVRYRGIFLNDEDPALGGWMKTTYGGPNHRFYERVFELVLRLKGNYLWPAMWGRAFADDDPRSPRLADEYGIVIGTSHHEPMMRAHVEWERHGKGPWDYTKNADTLRAFWREGIARMGTNESVVSLGMRGDGDEPMTQGTAIELLQTIVSDQRDILRDITGKPPEDTPQVWALYKEVQDYFDAGMKVPDDVTLLFADDNWGNIRRLPKPGETRGGGYGVYYHFDYVGGPRNYRWLNTTQIERTWEQMHLAYAYGARRLWIVNVGDLKPMEFPISFFLDHAWKPEAFGLDDLERYPSRWAAEQFGAQHAQDIGELLTRYTQYNARRKPELLSPDTFSLVHDHEATRVVADWNALVERTRAIGAKLGPPYRDAYYQLVEYPVAASANLTAMYVAVGRNRLYAKQGRASANTQAELARRLFERDAELARVYEQDIAGGKWVHMMSQPRIGYTGWQQPERNIMPALSSVAPKTAASMGVAIEGDTAAWPGAKKTAALPPLDPFAAKAREITLFNRGTTPFRFEAQASEPWLRVTPASGDVTDDRALRVDIDWNAVPPGTHTARISLRGDEGTRVSIDVPVENPADAKAITGFVESEGRIAIEAAHYGRAVANGGVEWRTIPNLGRTLSGVTSFPVTAPAGTTDAQGAWLEYPVHLTRDGDFDVRLVMSPTLDVQHRGGPRYAVSIDRDAPTIVTVKSDPTPGHADFGAWTRAVSDSVYVGTSRHRAKAGAHTLRIWRVDPGVVLQRVEIARDGARSGYLGAPESPRL